LLSRPLAILVPLVLIAPLGACSGALSGLKSTLGLEKQAPDEFGVVARAPLSLPPDYGLRPPKAGALRPQDTTPTAAARNTVFHAGEKDGGTASLPVAQEGRTVGEVALLQQAGAGSADPNIRRIVSQENSRLLEADRDLIDRLIFWRKPEPPGIVVDPAKEAQRLRQNLADGKPTTEGETPIIERKKKALLEGLF
jgi:Protein of unknown function (DUF3035)